MGLELLKALLGTFGYEIQFRELEWVECLLLKDEETWLGRGRDRHAALEASLRAACPSSLARALLEEVIRKSAIEASAHERRALEAREPKTEPAIDLGPITVSARVGEEEPTDELALVVEASQEARSDAHRPAPSMPSMPSMPSAIDAGPSMSASPVVTRDLISTVSLAAVAAAPTRPYLPAGGRNFSARAHPAPPPLVRRDSIVYLRIDPARAREELEILGDRIRDSREELGLCAPERQRLAMLAWICEARAHTDTFPDDTRIRDRVGAISRQLTDIGKTFWPGSVTALQLQMQPRDLPRHVLGGPTTSWARAAELAERALRTHEYTDERRGFDPYGWADASMTTPPPQDPADRLAKLIEEIEGFGGPIAHNAVPKETDARPEPAVFLTWVRRLRWLRGSAVDPDRWARLAGRLRWWANHREAPLVVPSRELDPTYAPTRPWAIELGAISDGAPSNADPPSPARGLKQELIEGIRSATSGKRLVFVSMRRDPDLQTELKEALPSATLDWRVAEPKRLESLGEAIQHGAYDVVLGALGFQAQGTDNLLARACRAAGVKYLRVNRGNPASCLRALARDLPAAGA